MVSINSFLDLIFENEPNVFPDYAGNYFGFTFVVNENPEVDGSGSGKGTYGWSGYHNTHFWIDPENKIYGLFMSRAQNLILELRKIQTGRIQ